MVTEKAAGSRPRPTVLRQRDAEPVQTDSGTATRKTARESPRQDTEKQSAPGGRGVTAITIRQSYAMRRAFFIAGIPG